MEKLEAMTCVCSVGLDMIAIPGDTTATTISGIIADEMAIGMVNQKTTAVRLIPVIGKDVGDMVEFGGLLGYAPVMPVNQFSCEAFVTRRRTDPGTDPQLQELNRKAQGGVMAKDMTKGNPGKTLFFFAVPMVLGNLFQQLYNIIDSIIVGNYVGADALAAVGASSSITFLFVAIATGLSIGSSVVISQYFGAKRYGEMKTAIQTVLLASFVIALCLMLVGIFGTDAILRFMQTPQKIFSDASLYLKIYFCGLVFLFLYNMLTASFNAIGDSKSPLVFLALSSVCNIVLDLYFVTKLKMGVAGAALATDISQAISVVVSFLWLCTRMKKMKTQQKSRIFDLHILEIVLQCGSSVHAPAVDGVNRDFSGTATSQWLRGSRDGRLCSGNED